MKIAVTYDNGNVFQHFGKTENFKVYEVEDNKVVSSEVIGSNGTGHGALAGLLAEQGIDVLICGGIGGGAQTALAEAGIQLCSGAQGNTDEVVEAYLKGELESAGTTCDHHHEEGHSCGNHEEGESCGSSCGGCGSHMPETLILTAEFDPLRDEGEEYGKRLKEAGNYVEIHRIPDALHGYFALGIRFLHVQESFEIMNCFLNKS